MLRQGRPENQALDQKRDVREGDREGLRGRAYRHDRSREDVHVRRLVWPRQHSGVGLQQMRQEFSPGMLSRLQCDCFGLWVDRIRQDVDDGFRLHDRT